VHIDMLGLTRSSSDPEVYERHQTPRFKCQVVNGRYLRMQIVIGACAKVHGTGGPTRKSHD